jgi:rhamnosyltransferase
MTDLQNLEKVRSQVETLVIVDNGSAGKELDALRETSTVLNAVLLENGTNLGIAAALNIGIKWAITHEQEWVALFDQDSSVTEGYICSMLQSMKGLPAASRAVLMSPRYQDPVSGLEERVALHKDGGPFISRTSGSFLPISVFSHCGFFTEELFIYCVDDDFSLRLRSKGFSIGQSGKAILLHSAGKPTIVSIFGKRYTTRNYRPEVQYYWARNRVWLMRKHGAQYPQIIFSSLRSLFGIPLKIAFGEKMRRRKIGMFGMGILHGIMGKTGALLPADSGHLAKQVSLRG